MHRAIPLAVFIAFLFCYLEWGHRGAFVFQMEYDILFSGDTEASAFLHPAIAIPLAGQVILLICSFRKHPNRRWVLGGVLLLSCLVLLIFLAGLLSMRAGMIISCLPFLGMALYAFLYRRLHRHLTKS